MRRTAAVLVGIAVSGSASASNFSYTYLEATAGLRSLDDDLVFQGEVYEEFDVGSLTGSYQVNDHFALLASGSVSFNDGPDTEITTTRVVVGGSLPVPVGYYADLVPQFGFVSEETESCLGNDCATEDDDGISYGLNVRAWAVPDRLELLLGWSDSTLDDSDFAVSVGAALRWGELHGVRLTSSTDADGNTTTIGYRYTWR